MLTFPPAAVSKSVESFTIAGFAILTELDPDVNVGDLTGNSGTFLAVDDEGEDDGEYNVLNSLTSTCGLFSLTRPRSHFVSLNNMNKIVDKIRKDLVVKPTNPIDAIDTIWDDEEFKVHLTQVVN